MKYQATVRLKALVGFAVQADSPEQALKLAREEMKSRRFIGKGVEYIDGREDLVGIDENWDLD
jgi:hypothetical protein